MGPSHGTAAHFSGPALDRKPGPYKIFVAAARLDLDLGRSWMVGDRETDVECARAAGVRPILIGNEPDTRPDGLICASGLTQAAEVILRAP